MINEAGYSPDPMINEAGYSPNPMINEAGYSPDPVINEGGYSPDLMKYLKATDFFYKFNCFYLNSNSEIVFLNSFIVQGLINLKIIIF